MKIDESFENFYNKIHLEDCTEYNSAIKNITKKLNEFYYDDSEYEDVEQDHCHIVGSIGRGTAIVGVSDVDMLFELPESIYERYDAYTSNGQSALLQDIKKVLLERYPRTDIKGDGQAVVIEFNKFSIDLVPAFLNYDNSFRYPDTNDGGSWKNTNPYPEQEKSSQINSWSNNNFVSLANMMRDWKDNAGFVFGGLLIDTLVYKFLCQNTKYWNSGFDEYDDIIQSLLKYLSEQDKDTKIYALGSGQEIVDKGKGSYILFADEMYQALLNAQDENEQESVFITMFGKAFEESLVDSTRMALREAHYRLYNCAQTEEFIEDKFPVHIKYHLAINCRVSADGWRPMLLKFMKALPIKRKLEFFIEEINVPKPYKIYWKVRNVGATAMAKNCIRGQIFEGKETKKESSDFNGPHYVECYIVKNNVCVARRRLPVNIEEN